MTQPDPADSITPTEIEHSIDEVWIGGELQQRYNFLDYHFTQSGAYLRARAYLDQMDRVALFGPFEGRQILEPAVAPEALNAVLDYLHRRYRRVERR
jgi:hypothetical protein